MSDRTDVAETESLAKVGRLTIAVEIAGLQHLQDSLSDEFAQVVAKIRDCPGRVIVVGVGKSGHIGNKIAATFASTGTPAFFVHAAEAAHGDLGMIEQNDVVLCLSNSGESAEFKPILQFCRRFSITMIAMTSAPHSSLGRYADLLLLLPKAEEACPMGLAPMTSTTMMLAMGDALASALMRSKGFARDDFAKFHPAGKLGAQLLRLREVMEMYPDRVKLPTVDLATPMRDVIATITAGRCGLTAVTDADDVIVGVVTDGDLRRALTGRESFDKTAEQMMTRDPISIDIESLAVEALNLCHNKRLGAVFIRDESGAVVGAAHLKDLLELGIA
ncbi:KpsF/GutQ family sugar-phosphate isomerase [Notoacmeibacter ruber]|uniref:KpsF/GutQ family sugar-phosphate isomerase n=2 Tax=Notoacmeibacter ruber TaxID=2670375 RepID=A0A3L7JGE4_9HYPH|nr:KpsF/GutQ family sugar-phosphate isomerase [Notoacmeibacter ruber]